MTALMNKGIVVMVKADGTRDRNKFSVQVVSLNSAYTLRRRYTDDVMYTLCLMSLAAMGIAVGGMEDNAFSQ
jgi:hypothetical protein